MYVHLVDDVAQSVEEIDGASLSRELVCLCRKEPVVSSHPIIRSAMGKMEA